MDSVTTKLILDKPHLVKWAVKLGFEWMETRWGTMTKENRDSYLEGAVLAHTEVRDFAGDIGSITHQALEDWANKWIENGSRPPDIKEFIPADANYRVVAAARSGEAAIIKTGCIPIACELLVGSRRFKSAGTLDLLMWNPKYQTIELFDYKSSNAVHDEYAIQTAAYKRFFEDMTGLKITTTKILHLSKDYDKFSIYIVPNPEEDFKAFLGISKAYDWRKDGRKKLEKDIKVLVI